MLTKIDEKKIEKIVINTVTSAINDVMIPAMDRMEERLASKEDLKEVENRLSSQINSLERKFEAQQERLDRHDARISTLEKIHPQGKHAIA